MKDALANFLFGIVPVLLSYYLDANNNGRGKN